MNLFLQNRHFRCKGFSLNRALDKWLSSGQQRTLVIEQKLFSSLLQTTFDKRGSECIANMLAGPVATARGTHTFDDGFSEDIGFAACTACCEITIWTRYTFSGALIERFVADLAGGHGLLDIIVNKQ
jgi:hypothetical protein